MIVGRYIMAWKRGLLTFNWEPYIQFCWPWHLSSHCYNQAQLEGGQSKSAPLQQEDIPLCWVLGQGYFPDGVPVENKRFHQFLLTAAYLYPPHLRYISNIVLSIYSFIIWHHANMLDMLSFNILVPMITTDFVLLLKALFCVSDIVFVCIAFWTCLL